MSQSDPAQEVFTNFVTMRRLIAGSIRKLKHPQIPPSQFELLFTAARNSGSSLKELAEIMQLTPGAVTQLVEALEAQGLAERQLSAKDRRSSQLTLTAKGHAAIESVRKVHKQLFQDMTSSLSQEEIQNLIAIQHKMIATLKEKSKH